MCVGVIINYGKVLHHGIWNYELDEMELGGFVLSFVILDGLVVFVLVCILKSTKCLERYKPQWSFILISGFICLLIYGSERWIVLCFTHILPFLYHPLCGVTNLASLFLL